MKKRNEKLSVKSGKCTSLSSLCVSNGGILSLLTMQTTPEELGNYMEISNLKNNPDGLLQNHVH